MWKNFIKLQSNAPNRICLQCCILHNRLEWINKKLPGQMPCPVWVLCLGLAGNRTITISWVLVTVSPNALCLCVLTSWWVGTKRAKCATQRRAENVYRHFYKWLTLHCQAADQMCLCHTCVLQTGRRYRWKLAPLCCLGHLEDLRIHWAHQWFFESLFISTRH